MARPKLIVGNWKMYKTVAEAVAVAKEFKSRGLDSSDSVWLGVCPPFIALHAVAQELKGTKIGVGAQNCHWEKEGAFTGEVSCGMIKEAGASYVLVAHSERRQFFGETNETANKKVKAALAEGLDVILCVGENLAEREGSKTFDVVKDHLLGSLKEVTAEQMKHVAIAYEPVWAIGTGKTASPAQAQEVHAYLRGLLKEKWGQAVADVTTIQYGGSVKPENVKELMSQPDIDGALVGGASLKADSFEKLAKF
jgi:triosephosphate isomerase